MRKIAVTGTIGSGKSTVSNLLKRRHLLVFNADNYAKLCLQRTSSVFPEIINAFGDEILDNTGEIDRKKLADIVFHDEEKRKQLNSFVHPFTISGMQKFFENHKEEQLLFAEVPLLYESGADKMFDEILCVTCTHENAVKRLMENRGYTKEQAESRLNSQISPEIQIQRADYVIHNDGTMKDLEHETARFLNQVRKEQRWN